MLYYIYVSSNCVIFATFCDSVITWKQNCSSNCIVWKKSGSYRCQFSLLNQDDSFMETEIKEPVKPQGLPVRVTLIWQKSTSWDPAGRGNPCNDCYKLLAFKGSWMNKSPFWHLSLGNGFLLSRVPGDNSPACQMPHSPNSAPQKAFRAHHSASHCEGRTGRVASAQSQNRRHKIHPFLWKSSSPHPHKNHWV